MNVCVELREVLAHLCAMLLLLELRFSYFFDYEPNNSTLRSVASLRALALNINIKQESCPATLLEQIGVAFAAYETLENIMFQNKLKLKKKHNMITKAHKTKEKNVDKNRH
ncbi:hypothetical protein GQX74_014420, partial [Glossina fuscipes]